MGDKTKKQNEESCADVFVQTECEIPLSNGNYLSGTLTSRTSRPHTCTVCDVSFRTSNGLYYHERMKCKRNWKPQPDTCIYCGENFQNLKDLQEHMQIHARYHTIPLTKTYSRQDTILGKADQKQQQFICDKCKNSFSDIQQLRVHELKHANGSLIVYTCQLYSQNFVDVEALVRHSQEHATKGTNCPNCKRDYPTELGLLSHKCDAPSAETVLPKVQCEMTSVSTVAQEIECQSPSARSASSMMCETPSIGSAFPEATSCAGTVVPRIKCKTPSDGSVVPEGDCDAPFVGNLGLARIVDSEEQSARNVEPGADCQTSSAESMVLEAICEPSSAGYAIQDFQFEVQDSHEAEEMIKQNSIGKLLAEQITEADDKTFECKTCKNTFSNRARFFYHFRGHSGNESYTCKACCENFSSGNDSNSESSDFVSFDTSSSRSWTSELDDSSSSDMSTCTAVNEEEVETTTSTDTVFETKSIVMASDMQRNGTSSTLPERNDLQTDHPQSARTSNELQNESSHFEPDCAGLTLENQQNDPLRSDREVLNPASCFSSTNSSPKSKTNVSYRSETSAPELNLREHTKSHYSDNREPKLKASALGTHKRKRVSSSGFAQKLDVYHNAKADLETTRGCVGTESKKQQSVAYIGSKSTTPTRTCFVHEQTSGTCCGLKIVQNTSKPSPNKFCSSSKDDDKATTSESVQRKTLCTKARHACKFCGKKFRHLTALRSHLLIHTKRLAFLCDKCGESFARALEFRLHSLIHIKPSYVCSVCKETFAKSSHLLIHFESHQQKLHRNENQNETITKSKSFVSNGSTRKKLYIFKCQFCTKTFPTNFALNRHCKVYHARSESSNLL